MLFRLLPPGRLWLREVGGILYGVLLASADELARIHLRALDLLEEADPRTAVELLADYERVLDLPSDGTEAERQARIVSKVLLRPRVRPADYQEMLASVLGQDAEDVVVIEVSRADAIEMEDDRMIYQFYIYRDPAAPGAYDLEAAQQIVDDIQHSHTRGTLIESTNFLCDDEFSLCDRDILGA